LHRCTILTLTLCLCGLVAPRAAADCGEPVSTAELLTMLEQAEWAYGQADLPGFSQASEQLRVELPCASEQLPRNIAARVHRAVGLRGFVERDPDVSTRAFAAARAIEPNYSFPSSMVPDGNPVLADYNAVPTEAGQHRDVLPPADGGLVFDGRPGISRPLSWPSIVQFVASTGEVTDTLYLWPDQSLPVYEVATERPEPIPEPGAAPPRGPAVSLPLLAVAGGCALASGGLYLASRSAHADFYDPGAELGELEAIRARHNALVWASRGGAAGAVLAGAGAVLVVRW
jgi:hypothetical protein